MGLEIERKFLVADDRWREAAGPGTVLRQGYLSTERGRTVRVRLAAAKAWLTIKGPSAGCGRQEFEYAIPGPDAAALLQLCEPLIVVKTRYEVPYGGCLWEVDVFDDVNRPLVVAEVELDDPAAAVALPDWIGAEVTGDVRYRNSNLARCPFSRW